MAAQKTMGTEVRKTSGTPATLAGIVSITPIGVTSNKIPTTTIDSEGGHEESIGGLKTQAEITIEGLDKDSGVTSGLLFGLANSQSYEEWEVEYPDGEGFEFEAWVSSFEDNGAEVDGVRGYTAVLTVVGAIDELTPALSV
jgi:predicted secreted protein